MYWSSCIHGVVPAYKHVSVSVMLLTKGVYCKFGGGLGRGGGLRNEAITKRAHTELEGVVALQEHSLSESKLTKHN